MIKKIKIWLNRIVSCLNKSDVALDVLTPECRSEVERIVSQQDCYIADEMIVAGHNLSFVNEKEFARAYDKGINSGHRLVASGEEPLDLRWRVHICCWAAKHALRLDGDFVECGVNTGIFPLSICHYLDFNNVKIFFTYLILLLEYLNYKCHLQNAVHGC